MAATLMRDGVDSVLPMGATNELVECLADDFVAPYLDMWDVFRDGRLCLESVMFLKCTTNRRWQENFKGKHNVDAKFGWYRFTTRFALPVYNSNTGELERFNVFRIEMLIRHAADGNLYLYDMVNIKKETSTPLEQ